MRFFYKFAIIIFCLLCISSTIVLHQNNAYQESGEFCANISENSFPLEKYEQKSKTEFHFGGLTLNQIENLPLPNEVILGGQVVGIGIRQEGVIVVGTTEIITQEGSISPIKEGEVQKGDILLKVNDRPIKYTRDIEKEMERDKKIATLHLSRDGKEFSVKVKPAKDALSGKRKLGLFVKESVEGIGTLTYIREDNNRFGALGHGIVDVETGKTMEISKGDLYRLAVSNITKGTIGKAGCLNGAFVDKNQSIGEIDKGNSYGLYGKVESPQGRKIQVGDRTTVKCGKAQIVSNLSGEVEYYEIEIVKTSFQPKTEEKGMVIKITDEKLIALTGGIVQGMSGSPIIQDGKLIGAVTHVFINDPLRGYGLYIDFMLNN